MQYLLERPYTVAKFNRPYRVDSGTHSLLSLYRNQRTTGDKNRRIESDQWIHCE